MRLQLPATLRAIEAGRLLPVVWDDNLPGSTYRHAVVGAAWAEIEIGGVLLAAEIVPLTARDGYVWTVVGPVSDDILLLGIASTLADAKACAAVGAVALAADILAA